MGGHVFDTCVVLDLEAVGLLAVAVHNLPHAAIGRLAAGEPHELKPFVADLERWGVRVHALTGHEIQALSELRHAHRSLSAFDVEALLVAKRRRAVLLTNEAPLRHLAVELAVPVHGSLWVISELVKLLAIDPPAAMTALNALEAANPRLPVKDRHRLRRELERRLGS